MSILLGSLPILTALIGFLVFSDVNKEVEGASVEENTVVSLTYTPTNTPTFTPSPTATPTSTPTPQDKTTEQDSPQEETANNNIGTNDLLTQINNFRKDKGLSPLQADDKTCFFASVRAQEIQSGFTHDGFKNRIDSGNLPYPSYSQVAENIAMNPDPGAVVPGWIKSPGHNENMSKDVPFGCVVGNGEFYVFEAWAP